MAQRLALRVDPRDDLFLEDLVVRTELLPQDRAPDRVFVQCDSARVYVDVTGKLLPGFLLRE